MKIGQTQENQRIEFRGRRERKIAKLLFKKRLWDGGRLDWSAGSEWHFCVFVCEFRLFLQLHWYVSHTHPVFDRMLRGVVEEHFFGIPNPRERVFEILTTNAWCQTQKVEKHWV